MSTPVVARRTRKDALENRESILGAARHAFAKDGLNASMDAIAKDAAVGAGTLYRHFPTKDALLAALLEEHYQALERRRHIIEAEEKEPHLAFSQWLEALEDWMLAYDGLPEPLRAAWSEAKSPLAPTCQSVIETTERLLRAAQDAGRARQSLTGRDIFLSALAIAWASRTTTAHDNTRTAMRRLLEDGWTTGSEA